MPQRLIFPAAATPAIKPVDAAFRRRDALSQVRGLLHLGDPQERVLADFRLNSERPFMVLAFSTA